jgi:signal peptidase
LQQSKYTTEEQIEAMRGEILLEKQKAAGAAGAKKRLMSRRQVLKVFEWVLFLSLFVFLVVTLIGVYAAKERGETPTVFGIYQLYSVESGSMEPTLTVGSVIVCEKTHHPESLEAGQIVTFHTLSGVVVTHRVVEVVKDENGNVSYRTKGDNPVNTPDEELLTPDRVIGVFALKIPFT